MWAGFWRNWRRNRDTTPCRAGVLISPQALHHLSVDELGELVDHIHMSTDIHASTRAVHVVDPPAVLDEMLDLARFLDQHAEPAALIGPDGEQIPLPLEAYQVLKQIVGAMQRGDSVSVEPLDKLLTTQQAADLLGISRSTLVRLLQADELPYERLGDARHRRLRLHDVLAYRDRKRNDRRQRLDEMTRQGSEDGLYDVDADAYRSALMEARRR